MRRVPLRLAFFAWALVVSPLVVWLLREVVYRIDGVTGEIWMIGLPALLTIAAGALMHRALWELVLGASLSAGVAVSTVVVAIYVGCQGKTDCL